MTVDSPPPPPAPPSTATSAAPSTAGRRARSAVAVVAGVLAVFGLVVGGISLWAGRTALDSQEMAGIVADAVTQPDIADAIARRIVDDTAEALGLRESILEFVPDLLERRADVFLEGVRELVAQQLSEFLQTDRARAVVESAALLAHRQLMSLLQGDGLIDGVAVEDGAVKLNLLPLVARGLGFIQGFGLIDPSVEIPEFDRAGDPAEQRAELEDALGRDLPEGFGEVTVYESEALAEAGAAVERAQDAFVLAKRAVWITLIVGAVMAAVAVLLSRNRWRTAVVLAVSVSVLFLAVRWTAAVAARRVPDAITQPSGQRAADEILSDLLQSLTRATILYLVLAAAVVVAAVVVHRRGGAEPVPEPAPAPAV